MLDWDTIDTVLFDLDGTLIDLRLDACFWKEIVPQAYAEKNAVSPTQSRQKLKRLYHEVEHSMQWYDIDHWADTLNLPIRDMQRAHAVNTQVRSGVYSLLTTLKSMDKRLMILTDSHPFSLQVKMENCDLAPHFDHLISSHEFQQPKMNSTLWTALYRDYQIDPNRTLLLDDIEAVLDQAKQNRLAYTIGIENPDSRLPPKSFQRHHSIDDFHRLLEQADDNG
ncbi:HAD family hydrolase [Chelonobacter oris]|uniref:HAD family hydrolase n=1 Tax=Chelonobacter oris TaxID=505317 RepID=A0A0A3ALS8_9PAST|nr:GMP/IMP nucleotidase [Chelonobacter oris]KGQ70363.1 HAD family hydrolase [Chelonobacter oris]MDH3000900.1 HAD family hydrolase [Chelonobacter oris]